MPTSLSFFRWLAPLALLWLAGCASAPSERATSTQVEIQQRGRVCEVHVREAIDQAAVQRLSQALNQAPASGCDQRWLVIHASDGQIGAAVTMGSMVRNRQMGTRVAPGTDCLSACVLVFAAGQARVLDAQSPIPRLGISRIPPDADFGTPRCEAEISRAQALTLARYLRAMLPSTAADAVFQVMAQTDCRAPRYWRPSELTEMGLVTAVR